jgi:simple sugar transport system permease protein
MTTETRASSGAAKAHAESHGRRSGAARVSALYARHREVAALLVALLLFCYFLARSGSSFVLRGNMATLAQYVAPVALIAVGESMLLIAGEIDLSAGNVYALAPFVTMYLAADHVQVVLATVIAIALSAVIGLVNGLVTVYLRVPSFVTTLGMLNLINGVTLVVTNGATGTPAGGRLYDKIMGGGNWSEFIWAIAVVVVWAYLLGWTRFGTYTFAVGGNQVAAREAGINVARVKIWNFVLMGAIAGLTGILDGVRVAALDPTSGGTGLMFDGVAAAVIGGTALVGGSGSVVGALFGAFFLEILYDGFTLEGVSAFDFDIIIGAAILVAMVVNIQFQELRARHSAEELLGTAHT